LKYIGDISRNQTRSVTVSVLLAQLKILARASEKHFIPRLTIKIDLQY